MPVCGWTMERAGLAGTAAVSTGGRAGEILEAVEGTKTQGVMGGFSRNFFSYSPVETCPQIERH